MATVKSVSDLFGKLAVEFGDKAWKAWKPEVWQPLGIKDRTAQQRATSNGQGGTRAAMLACMATGFSDMAMATQAAAYVRYKYLGNTSVTPSGISYGWFTTYANMATVASNATFKANPQGLWKLAATNGKRPAPSKATDAPTVAKAPKAPRKASDSRNGEVTVTFDPALKAAAQAAADIRAANATDGASNG